MDELLKTLKIDKVELIEYLHGRLDGAFKYLQNAPSIKERRIVVVISNNDGDILFSRQIGYDNSVKVNAKYWKAAFENIDIVVERSVFLFGGAIRLNSGFVVSVNGPFGDTDFLESLSGHIASKLGIISVEEKTSLSESNQVFNFSNFGSI